MQLGETCRVQAAVLTIIPLVLFLVIIVIVVVVVVATRAEAL